VSPRALPGEQRAANSAATQLRRLLHLLPEVSDGAPRKLDDLAARAGTDRRTLLADLRQLAYRYDDPGGFVEGVHIYLGQDDVEVSSSHFLRPMRLTLSELRSLELGLAMLAHERPPEERAAIERARKRLRQAIAKLPDQDIECGWLESAGPTGVDLDTIAQLRKAIRERRVVRLNYQSGSATEPTWRDVHPLGLIFHSGMWYLVADGGGEYRFFRADRMHGVQDQGERFAPPAGLALDGLIGKRMPFSFSGPEMLVVRYGPTLARWLAEREGGQLAADGSLTAAYHLGDLDWAMRLVLRYGEGAELLDPRLGRHLISTTLRACAST
jgi:predicted DNA-binding transcriptional regulator YafY